MDEYHSPLQLVKQLRQILSADKLSVGFFLGAGCPCSIRIAMTGSRDAPLIPGIAGLTESVSESLESDASLAIPFKRLHEVLSDDGITEINIEVLLSRIRSLHDAAGTDEARGISSDHLFELDRRVCEIISQTVTRELPTVETPYHSLAWFVGNQRTRPSEIFTTNYDLLTEQALEASHVPFFDGFVGSCRPFFDQHAIEDDRFPERWTHLWKLHGSINWRFNRDSGTIIRSQRTSDGDELLIHPSHLKYDESRRMPYVVMMDRLKAFLRNGKEPVAVFVVGHSFSDEHLNATIMECLRVNSRAACYALQFEDLSQNETVVKLAETQNNLSVIARDGAIIRSRRAKWLLRPADDFSYLSPGFELDEQVEAENRADGNMGRSSEPGSEEAPRRCRAVLGDFKHFGRLLDSVSGRGLFSHRE